MIQGGFLNEQDRGELIALARDGSVVCRVTRRANPLVLLDAGWSCQEVAKTFLLDDDTIRGWRKLFEQRGIITPSSCGNGSPGQGAGLLHFIPPFCPHLNPIERLCGLMHRHVTHNKCYAACGQFADATLDFLRDKGPKNWGSFRDFRVITQRIFGF